jgi:hypothetical protein
MDVILRPGALKDAEACGVIVFEAFKSISSQHNFGQRPRQSCNGEVKLAIT